MRRATENLVRSLGHQVRSFASADEFLRSSDVNDTACLIADIRMPGMNGLELQKNLSDQGNRASIIFVTSYFDERTEELALKAGAICFLGKPFDGKTLLQCLCEALRRYRDGVVGK